MDREIIFITGYFGAPIMERAVQLAGEKNCPLTVLDDEIEKSDGRSVKRICMVMGEHEYRNKEYEQLKQIVERLPAEMKNTALVVACGDGVLLDDMSRDLISSHILKIIGADMTVDRLWENACHDRNTYHAFMHFGTEEKRREAFNSLHERQQALFADL